jgi:hypothetical protein
MVIGECFVKAVLDHARRRMRKARGRIVLTGLVLFAWTGADAAYAAPVTVGQPEVLR